MRLEHLFAPGENSETSVPVAFSLRRLLSDEGYGLGHVLDVQETTLGANQWAETSQRLRWDNTHTWSLREKAPQKPDFDITLKPFDIRTFIVQVE